MSYQKLNLKNGTRVNESHVAHIETGIDGAYDNANSVVGTHNTSGDAHQDIRLVLQQLADRINAVLDSDDTTLDELSEIVAYIKSNKSLIDAVTTSKVNVADIVNNLTSNVANKPLSAAQGVALKALIDAITIPTKLAELREDANHRVVTDAEKAAWDAKSNFSGNYNDLAGKPTIPTVPVKSVNGKTGEVNLSASDVGALPSTYTPPNQTAQQVGADPAGTASGLVSKHNTATDSHADIRSKVSSVADKVGGIDPVYVIAEAESVIERVLAAQGARTFTFVVITDIHYGNGGYTDGVLHACQAMKYVDKRIKLDAVAVLGDYTDGYPSTSLADAMADYRAVNALLDDLRFAPNLRQMGNHDYYADNAPITRRLIQAYSDGVVWGSRQGGYYHKDFDDYKLRVICPNCNENNAMDTSTNKPTGNVSITAAQAQWFADTLASLNTKSDASEWQVLVLTHQPLDWYDSQTGYALAKVVDAYKEGKSFSNSSVSCSFAGKNAARLICNIHGHIHNLLIDKVHTDNVVNGIKSNVIRIATPEACINRANQYDGAWKDATTYNKTTNSSDDTSFVVYCINLDAGTIKAVCYGAGYDRDIDYFNGTWTGQVLATYTITNKLTNCTASGATTIKENGGASLTVTANSGYELPDSVTVTGATYTWNKATGELVLSKPSGNVTVTVVAVEVVVEPSYTNQIPLSINSDGSQYVGAKGEDGYKMGTRLNSSGTESSADATVGVVGFIPVKAGDVIYLENIKMSKAATGGVHEQAYISLYDSTFAKTSSKKPNLITSSDAYLYDNFVTDANGYIKSFKIVDTYNNVVGSGGYMRISADGMGANSIITVNQPIV